MSMKPEDYIEICKQQRQATDATPSWQELVELVRTGHLERLGRSTRDESLYQQFRSAVARDYPSVTSYLAKRLDWPINHDDTPELFDVNIPADSLRLRVNDWAYDLPNDVTHWLAWSKRPILAPGELRGGCRGFLPPHTILLEPDLTPTEQEADQRIRAFVGQRFPPQHFETIYFVNPPLLQSVLAVPHVHVFAKRSTTQE
ncbi:uncharacterized protein L969DRAFT_86475 [Mixia osmundae IAM 14324]|uniref:uncharacterized protein n=1 Tax=Mixia osmundae (strain CBS 9802 / IAM 14324 / JCM 22182 / KY 12970) TaxID=764103 RepID=UPI0004A553FC|nr:uncharacterized protein L969DRAFT_86475 [Mixia osmundae IAM 14324]KEI39877.1 hypothetical protein L969DRAFT_86475 [Mixia osmundae IAM 14324]